MKTRSFLILSGSILALGALLPAPHVGAQYYQNSADLLKFGNQFYNTNCVTGSKYYFAYMQREQAITSADRVKMKKLIYDCEAGHAGTGTGSAGNDGKYDGPNSPAAGNPKEKRCAAYALLAVTAQRINQRAGCGLGGNRWSLDYDSHYNWCMDANVSAQELRTENTIRSNALNTCVFN